MFSDDVDISLVFRCVTDVGSVGTVVAGITRIADEDIGDPNVNGYELGSPEIVDSGNGDRFRDGLTSATRRQGNAVGGNVRHHEVVAIVWA